MTAKSNTSSLASSAARSILISASAGMAGVGMSAASGPNAGIDASGFDYIEGSGFVMEGLEDKGLDAKSYIQSVLRRHEGKMGNFLERSTPLHFCKIRWKYNEIPKIFE